ncbi:hypothetical protein Hanom_Chr09g00796751 [Helianthus anomalus]
MSVDADRTVNMCNSHVERSGSQCIAQGDMIARSDAGYVAVAASLVDNI